MITTDIITISLTDLIIGDDYRVTVRLQNTSSYYCELDRYLVEFNANNTNKNLLFYLKKSSELNILLLEVETENLINGNKKLENSIWLCPTPTPTQTPSITPTETNKNTTPTPTSTPTLTPSISVTPTQTPSYTPTSTATCSIGAPQTPTPTFSPTNTTTPQPTPTPTRTPTKTNIISPTPTSTPTTTSTPQQTATPSPTVSSNNVGNLFEWGLAIGTDVIRHSPVVVGTNSDWSEIISTYSGGKKYNFIIKSDSSLYAYGDNVSGIPLGLGDTPATVLTPTRVGGNSLWKKIHIGGGIHVFGIKLDGSLWSWGYNVDGQLGLGYTSISAPPPYGTKIPTLVNSEQWLDVSCGLNFSHAIKSDGSLWACGANYLGDFGNGSASPFPFTSLTKIGNKKWKKIITDQHGVFGIQEDGSLWSWGLNAYGQLGLGTVSSAVLAPSRIGNDTWLTVSTASFKQTTTSNAYNNFSAGIKSDGTLWVWGDNRYGNFGNNTTTNSTIPVKSNNHRWIDVKCISSSTNTATNGFTILALREDSTMWTWGSNYQGALGVGSTNTTLIQKTPVQIPGYWKKISELLAIKYEPLPSPTPTPTPTITPDKCILLCSPIDIATRYGLSPIAGYASIRNDPTTLSHIAELELIRGNNIDFVSDVATCGSNTGLTTYSSTGNQHWYWDAKANSWKSISATPAINWIGTIRLCKIDTFTL